MSADIPRALEQLALFPAVDVAQSKKEKKIEPALAEVPISTSTSVTTPDVAGRTALWLAIYLPKLPLETLQGLLPANEPKAIVDDVNARARIVFVDDAAKKKGVYPGMLQSAACAVAPDLHICLRDEKMEQAAVQGLAAWAYQFSSHVSVDVGLSLPGLPAERAQGVLLEVGASLRLFSGLEALIAVIKQGVVELGYEPCVSVAATPGAAWILAKAGDEQSHTSEATLAGRLAPVAIERLGFAADAVSRLRGMGLKTFADIQRLPRAGFARRVGKECLLLLDKTLGKQSDPRSAYHPGTRYTRQLTFSVDTVSSEQLLAVLARPLRELGGYLAAGALGVMSVHLELIHRNCVTHERVSLRTPGRDPEHLEMLLREHLAQHVLKAPVQAVVLRAGDTRPLALLSDELFASTKRDQTQWNALLEQLTARLGGKAVRTLEACADHRPECAWRYRRVAEHQTTSTPVPRTISFNSPLHSAGCSVERPLWLLKAPQRLDMSDGQPWLAGTISLVLGPERIESGWWDEQEVKRDYYVGVNSHGQRLWLYRSLQSPRDWYLHGIMA